MKKHSLHRHASYARLLPLMLSFILFVGLIVTVYLASQKQDTRKHALGSAQISLSPSGGTYKTGQEITMEIKIDSASQKITMAGMELEYDPDFLTTSLGSISYESSLRLELVPKQIIDGAEGKKIIRFHVYNFTANISEYPYGQFILAKIRFQSVAENTSGTLVSLKPTTLIGLDASTATNKTVAANSASATYVISDSSAPTLTPGTFSAQNKIQVDFPSGTPFIIEGPPGLRTEFLNFASVVTMGYDYIFAIAGIILFIFIVWGGFGYLTSMGDPKKAASARNRITYAIVGFLVIFSAYWITQIVQYLFKLNP